MQTLNLLSHRSYQGLRRGLARLCVKVDRLFEPLGEFLHSTSQSRILHLEGMHLQSQLSLNIATPITFINLLDFCRRGQGSPDDGEVTVDERKRRFLRPEDVFA